MTNKEFFEKLFTDNVNGHTEKKSNGQTTLTYLSWSWAWAEFKKACPDATYEIKTNEEGKHYWYDPALGYEVRTSVTANGLTYDMWLPVMDGANKAMKAEPYTYRVKNSKHKYAKPRADGKFYDSYGNEQPEFLTKTVEAATMMDINKAIMRCLTKNISMFGLGLYIYAGEDLPEDIKEDNSNEAPAQEPQKASDAEVIQSRVNMPVQEEWNGNDLASDAEIDSLKALCEKAKQDPAKLFKNYNWPFLTKAQYASGAKQLRNHIEKTKNANQGAA